MAKMPQDCMDMINNVYAAAVATADANGVPNVVCCSMKQAYDDETVMISDQYMRKTLANVETGSKMAVSVWDETHGYQVKGSATYENEGERYEAIAAQVHQILRVRPRGVRVSPPPCSHVQRMITQMREHAKGHVARTATCPNERHLITS